MVFYKYFYFVHKILNKFHRVSLSLASRIYRFDKQNDKLLDFYLYKLNYFDLTYKDLDLDLVNF